MKENDSNNYSEKDVAFYSATINAWYTTKFEKDKHLLSLSAAGIGLLITLATTIGVKTSLLAIVYAVSITSYLLCILIVLKILSRNSNHLEKLIQEKEDSDPALAYLDFWASLTFIAGIIFTLLIGLFSNIDHIC